MTDTVVVSGAGLVSSLGSEPDAFWKRLCAGESGISTIQRWDTSALPVHFGAEVRDFDADGELGARDARLMDPFARYAVVAAERALDDAGLVVGEGVDGARVGVYMGSGIGGATTFAEEAGRFAESGIRELSPYLLTLVLTNMAAAQLAIRHGITGPGIGLSNACTSGANAVGEGMRAIRRGEVDVAVCGAGEAALYPLGVAAFARTRALSRRNDDPERASRPFDAGRDGFVLGEGAGVLVLESDAHARARGARPLARVAGYATSTDAHHVTMPEPDGAGALACMRGALADAGIGPGEVGYVNAHATGTKVGDVSEARAISVLFGSDQPPCSATKSATGHVLGASAAIEALICVQAVRTGVLPPTINLDEPDPSCALNHVSGGAAVRSTEVALSNSFGFGGHNASLVFVRE